MEYLDFIIEQKNVDDNAEFNLYEKVLVAAARAKDLCEDKMLTDTRLEMHKQTSAALFELKNDHIEPTVSEKDEYNLYGDDDFEDDELEEDI